LGVRFAAFLLIITVVVYAKIQFDGPGREYGPGYGLAVASLVLLAVKGLGEALGLNYLYSFPGDGYLEF
jgi:hypothetical protein